jgi:hypothetical protein
MPLNIKVEKRPGNILLVFLLLIALGIYMALVTIYALITESEIEGILVLESLDSSTAGLVSLAFSALFFILGYGIWKVAGWARTILMAFGVLGAVFYPLKGLIMAANMSDKDYDILTSDVIGGILTVIGIIISIVILLILSRPEVILAFEANEVVRIRTRIAYLNEKMEFGRKRCNDGEISKAEFSSLKSECIAEERILKGRIRHFDKVRLSRERKIKERIKRKEETKEERMERRKMRKALKEEAQEEEEPEGEEQDGKKEKDKKKSKPKGKKKKTK